MKFLDEFARIIAYDGVHYIRKDLIKEIKSYEGRLYLGDDIVDVRTVLVYDADKMLHFTNELPDVLLMMEGSNLNGGCHGKWVEFKIGEDDVES